MAHIGNPYVQGSSNYIARQNYINSQTTNTDLYPSDASTGQSTSPSTGGSSSGSSSPSSLLNQNVGTGAGNLITQWASGSSGGTTTSNTGQTFQDGQPISPSTPTISSSPSRPRTLSTPQLVNGIPQFTTGDPTGTKIPEETFQSLSSKGVLGSALRLEGEAIQPFDPNTGFDLGLTLRKMGLGISAIPAEAGQIGASTVARFFGQEPVFREDQTFVYKSQQGTRKTSQSFTLKKAIGETLTGLAERPIETSIDLGIKGVTLIPILTVPAKLGARGAKGASSFFAEFVPSTKLVAPEVASGATPFPFVKNVKEAIKIFNKPEGKNLNIVGGNKVVFHATSQSQIPIVGRSTTVTAGQGAVRGTDLGGLFASTKGVSTRFLRLGRQPLSLDYSVPTRFWPKIIPDSPSIRAIQSIPARLPISIRTNIGKAQTYFGQVGKGKDAKIIASGVKAPKGQSFFSVALETGAKKEAEVVFAVGTKTSRTGLTTPAQKFFGYSKFTKIDGRRIPIFEETTTTTLTKISGGQKATKIINSAPQQVLNRGGSSSGGSSGSSFLSSSTINAGANIMNAISGKPSKIVSSSSSSRTYNNAQSIWGKPKFNYNKPTSQSRISSNPKQSYFGRFSYNPSSLIGSSNSSSKLYPSDRYTGSSKSPSISRGTSGGSSIGGSSGIRYFGSSSPPTSSGSSSTPIGSSSTPSGGGSSSGGSSSGTSRTPPYTPVPIILPRASNPRTQKTRFMGKKFKLKNKSKLKIFWGKKRQ